MHNEQQPDAEDVNRRLLATYNELAELAGSLAHEIKNPLSVIRMNMDLLAEDFADAETPRERRALTKIETVQKQCTRLENLLRDFLKFARLRDLELSPGSLNEVVDRVLAFFEPQAKQSEIEFIRFLDPALPSIKLDEQTLHAALLNLVKNSLEAMPDGGRASIALSLETEPDHRCWLTIRVSDQGVGIEEEDLKKIFEPFFTTKEQGTGLGLAIVNRIVTVYGGTLKVNSVPGQGTEFTVKLPASG